MPIKKSALKELRKTKKRTLRNINVKKELEHLLKRTRKAIDANKIDEAKDWAKKTLKALDKAAQKRVIKKNTAARKKSRLMKKINKAVKK